MTFRPIRLALRGVLAAGALALAPAAWAQTALTTAEAPPVEIDRGALDFHQVAPKPTDPPLVYETALVLTNTGNVGHRVICKAFDDDGQAVGRAATFVPALGLRYLLASDFTGGAPLLGQVQCATRTSITGSAFLLGGGAGITEVPVSQTRSRRKHATRIQFPVVFTQ